MMRNEIHRTVEEIEEDIKNFMAVVESERKDIHDNCDQHECLACLGIGETPDQEWHCNNMDMYKTHIEQKTKEMKEYILESEKEMERIKIKYSN